MDYADTPRCLLCSKRKEESYNREKMERRVKGTSPSVRPWVYLFLTVDESSSLSRLGLRITFSSGSSGRLSIADEREREEERERGGSHLCDRCLLKIIFFENYSVTSSTVTAAQTAVILN